MSNNRTYDAISNSFFGIIGCSISVILNFFVRIILVKQLGAEMNGLHNLFQSIANVMTILELGFSSAMVIHLYKPIALKDIPQIKGIMFFYKKTYIYISCIYSCIGIVVALFLLDFLVETTIESYKVKIFFILFFMSFSINYLTYYKRSILYAEQKNRISSIFAAIGECVFRGLQIIILLYLSNYYLFLILWILEKLFINIACGIYVDKYHPYLKNNQEQISIIKKRAIFNTIKPLVINQVANTVTQSAKSILISILMGNVSIVGYFGNYQLITNLIIMVYTQFGGSITSSYGNLSAIGDKFRLKNAYFNSAFVLDWIAAIFCSGFIVCINPFIVLAFGEKFLLDQLSIASLLLTLVFYLINIPILSLQNALGLHRLDSKYMVIQALLSILLGYIGGIYYKMPGIFLGLLIPSIMFTTIRKGIHITGYACDINKKEYIKFILYEFIKIILCTILSYETCSAIIIESLIIKFIVYGIIACVIGIIVPIFLSNKSVEFLYVKSLIIKIIRKR